MRTLYISQPGCYVSLQQEKLVVKKGEAILGEVQLPLLEQVLIFGKSQLTTQAIRTCLWRNISIAYLSRMGYCYGRILPIERGYRQLVRYHSLAMLFYVVVYDIPCDKRRQKVHALLSGYGQWVQYSVFECVLSPAKYQEMRSRLQTRVNLDEDSIRFYPLSGHTLKSVETWGVGPSARELPGSVII